MESQLCRLIGQNGFNFDLVRYVLCGK